MLSVFRGSPVLSQATMGVHQHHVLHRCMVQVWDWHAARPPWWHPRTWRRSDSHQTCIVWVQAHAYSKGYMSAPESQGKHFGTAHCRSSNRSGVCVGIRCLAGADHASHTSRNEKHIHQSGKVGDFMVDKLCIHGSTWHEFDVVPAQYSSPCASVW